MKPEITVVIPLYNKERYIQRTIESVLHQSFQNFELIIVDSSNDGSTDVVRNYTDPRIRHIIREKRTYLPISRNIGANLAQADLIAFVDADDEWMPEHLEVLSALASEFPEAGVYATPYIKILPNGLPMTMVFANIPCPPWKGYIQNYFQTCARGDVPVCSSSSAVRKIIFDEVQGFDEALIHGGEDQHFWGRVALRHPIAFSWKGSAIYHTEAIGRMCNDPGPDIGDPLSDYLQGLLSSGQIPDERVDDVTAYIRRKRKMVWTGSILKRGRQGVSDETKPRKPSLTGKVSWIYSLTATGIRIYYNSRFRNTGRKLWCQVHGWHVPALE